MIDFRKGGKKFLVVDGERLFPSWRSEMKLAKKRLGKGTITNKAIDKINTDDLMSWFKSDVLKKAEDAGVSLNKDNVVSMINNIVEQLVTTGDAEESIAIEKANTKYEISDSEKESLMRESLEYSEYEKLRSEEALEQLQESDVIFAIIDRAAEAMSQQFNIDIESFKYDVLDRQMNSTDVELSSMFNDIASDYAEAMYKIAVSEGLSLNKRDDVSKLLRNSDFKILQERMSVELSVNWALAHPEYKKVSGEKKTRQRKGNRR